METKTNSGMPGPSMIVVRATGSEECEIHLVGCGNESRESIWETIGDLLASSDPSIVGAEEIVWLHGHLDQEPVALRLDVNSDVMARLLRTEFGDVFLAKRVD